MSLKIEGVNRSCGDLSLKDIRLEVRSGEYFVILGPTGAGKTMLLETIMGIHRQESGRILLDGLDITDIPTERRGIGYVPQQSLLFPHMTVRRNVEFGLRIRGMPAAQLRAKTDRVLAELGILDLSDRFPASLSGGEMQKVALARVMAIEPRLVLLDEPLSATDPETRQMLRDYLKRRQSEAGTSFLHVTHDQIEAFSIANRIAVMRDGMIMQTGSPKEIASNPKNEFVARFLGYENIFNGQVVRCSNGLLEVDVGGAIIKASAGGSGWRGCGEGEALKCVFGIRSDDIHITNPDVESENLFKGIVEGYADLGAIVKVSVRIDRGHIFHVVLMANAFIGANLDRGKTVWIAFNSRSVKVLSTTGALNA